MLLVSFPLPFMSLICSKRQGVQKEDPAGNTRRGCLPYRDLKISPRFCPRIIYTICSLHTFEKKGLVFEDACWFRYGRQNKSEGEHHSNSRVSWFKTSLFCCKADTSVIDRKKNSIHSSYIVTWTECNFVHVGAVNLQRDHSQIGRIRFRSKSKVGFTNGAFHPKCQRAKPGV